MIQTAKDEWNTWDFSRKREDDVKQQIWVGVKMMGMNGSRELRKSQNSPLTLQSSGCESRLWFSLAMCIIYILYTCISVCIYNPSPIHCIECIYYIIIYPNPIPFMISPVLWFNQLPWLLVQPKRPALSVRLEIASAHLSRRWDSLVLYVWDLGAGRKT